MLLYLWSREFPNANINLYGLVTLKVSLPHGFLASNVSYCFMCLWEFVPCTGILLAVGHALLRRHLWFSNCSWSFRHYCWASLLLPNSTASACWREEHTEDTSIFVSLIFAFARIISNFNKSLLNLQIDPRSTFCNSETQYPLIVVSWLFTSMKLHILILLSVNGHNSETILVCHHLHI